MIKPHPLTYSISISSSSGDVGRRQGEREEVGFRGEHKVIHVQKDLIFLSKQQEQILEGLSQDKRVHPI